MTRRLGHVSRRSRVGHDVRDEGGPPVTKKLSHDLTYDAPADAVAAMLADPAFREEVCDYQGVLRRDVTGERTTHEVRFDIKVSIPLVAGKIEGLISDMLLKALKAENKVGRDYLSR